MGADGLEISILPSKQAAKMVKFGPGYIRVSGLPRAINYKRCFGQDHEAQRRFDLSQDEPKAGRRGELGSSRRFTSVLLFSHIQLSFDRRLQERRKTYHSLDKLRYVSPASRLSRNETKLLLESVIAFKF